MVTRANFRRSTRSTSDPANRPNTTTGSAWASPTAPVHTVLRVCSQTWNITATSVIWAPKPEKTRPSQSRRKAGDVRSGVRSTKARVRDTAEL